MTKKTNQSVNTLSYLVLSSALLLGLSGCGSSSSGGSDDDPADDRGSDDSAESTYESATLDASDANSYRYFNLKTGSVVELTAEEAAASTDWHIAFSRYNVILNGGDSGPGNVGGALAAAQDDFYTAGDAPNNSVFLNATPDSEQEHLEAEYDATGFTFVNDEKAAAIQASGAMVGGTLDMGWYNYNMGTHAITLNDQNWWLLRSSAGNSYAIFRATALTYVPATGLDVTFEFDVQPSGVNQFTSTATFNAQIPPTGGEACFDFDTDTTAACEGSDWDLKLEIAGRDWNLWTNSGVTANGNGGAFGPLQTADADQYTSATVSPEGQDISFLYTVDRSAGVFEENGWYEYNLQGGHKLWPNYRVYLINTDTTDDTSPVYALQITSYYAAGGTSGHPTIRYVEQ